MTGNSRNWEVALGMKQKAEWDQDVGGVWRGPTLLSEARKARGATVVSSRNKTFKSWPLQCSQDLISFSLLIIFPGCGSQVSHPFSASAGGN